MFALIAFLCALLSAQSEEIRPSDAAGDALQTLVEALQRDRAFNQGLSAETREALRAVQVILDRRGASSGDVPSQPAEGPRDAPPSKGDIARIVDEYLAAKGVPREQAPWERILDQLSLYGDLRLRHESSVRQDGARDRHRERIRFRLGANYQLYDEVLLGVRMVTGDRDDPNSPHVTLGDGLDSLEISLDRAFLRYQPRAVSGATVTAGKFSHAFFSNPVYAELVWDGDIQPEGIAGGYSFSDFWMFERIDMRAGQYILLEQAGAKDTGVSVFQCAGRARIGENVTTNLALGYYHYGSTSPDGSMAILADNAGNATRDRDGDGTADSFKSHFGIVNPIVAVTYSGASVPVTVAAEAIVNARTGDRNQGWALGASIGSTRQQGDWRGYYQWQLVEQEAVFSAFAQDDFLLATNHRSHIFGVNYQLADKIGLHLWTLASQRESRSPGPTSDSDRFQWRFRVDVNVRF